MDSCLICQKSLHKNILHLRSNEKQRMIFMSKVRMDKRHVEFENSKNMRVHQSCCESYLSWEEAVGIRESFEVQLKEEENVPEKEYHPDLYCIHCLGDASNSYIEKYIKNPKAYLKVNFIKEKDNVLKYKEDLEERNSAGSRRLLRRLQGKNNEVPENVRYHVKCRLKFTTEEKRAPVQEQFHKSIPYKVFIIGKYILCHKEISQYNVTELMKSFKINRSFEFSTGIKLFFGESMIYHTKNDGIILSKKEIVVDALNNYYDSTKDCSPLLNIVANQIENEIQSLNVDHNNYPNPANFFADIDKFVPSTLNSLLALIIKDRRKRHSDQDKRYNERREIKINSLCHAIVHCSKPSIKSPIMLALGTVLYRKYGSSDLPKLLSSLGLCCSYYDVQLLEASIIACSDQPTLINPYFQHIYDNADYNTETIDAKNTFHVLGGVECVSPHDSISFDFPIPKLQKLPSAKECSTQGFIELLHYDPPIDSKGLESIKAVDILEQNPVDMDIKVMDSDFFWLFAKHETNFNYKGWKGFMEFLLEDNFYEKSRVLCLPFVNNSPTDMDTIYTALSYSNTKREEYSQKKIFVTFDQSLYVKAREIIARYSYSIEQNLNHVIIRLGGFHLIMSYMGCIGYVMNGSGIKKILSLIYAPNSVDKILDGHFYNRSMRAFLLLNSVLASLLLKDIQNTEFKLNEEELTFMQNHLHATSHEIKVAMQDTRFVSAHTKFSLFLVEVEKRGPTAKLWIQFFKMTTLLKQIEEAEKTGNWALHIQSVQKMIPFFHASGHLNYAESAHLYLQDMLTLTNILSPDEFSKFVTDGYFTIRRSDKFWGGIYSDQTIEQVLMKSIKTQKGIVNRGISDSVVSKWVGAYSAVLDIILAITSYSKVDMPSSEQHVESRPSRIETDRKHLLLLKEYFEENNPFPTSPLLISLDTGLIGNSTINCHNAYEVGLQILKGVTNKYFSDLKLKRNDKVLPLACMNSVFKINNEIIPVDPNLVFQRILLSKDTTEDDLEEYIDYELAPFPASLFDGTGFRKSQKSKLYALFKPIDDYSVLSNTNLMTIIDGGYMLHRVVWKVNDTYESIYKKFLNYVKAQEPCIVVFDGYPAGNLSTKSYERTRRSTKHHSASLLFLPDDQDKCDVSQENFLGNIDNKKLLIERLITIFQEYGVEAIQATEDADILIVETAKEKAAEHDTIQVIGDDIDLLILLTQHCGENSNIYFIKFDKKKKSKSVYTPKSFIYDKLKHIIAFIHAFGGCDTTSAFFQRGKETLFKIINEDEELITQIETFLKPDADREELLRIAADIVCLLYVKKKVPIENFNSIRIECYEKLQNDININRLPPTDSALQQHAFRVYLQCQDWFFNNLNPTDWGWKVENNFLIPVYTSKPLLPDKFLKKFNCGCSKGMAGCVSKVCTCKKLGLKCSVFCKVCKGRDCQNSENVAAENMSLDVEYDDEISMPLEPEVILDEDECMDESSILDSENFDLYEPEINMSVSEDESGGCNDNSVNVELGNKKRRLM